MSVDAVRQWIIRQWRFITKQFKSIKLAQVWTVVDAMKYVSAWALEFICIVGAIILVIDSISSALASNVHHSVLTGGIALTLIALCWAVGSVVTRGYKKVD